MSSSAPERDCSPSPRTSLKNGLLVTQSQPQPDARRKSANDNFRPARPFQQISTEDNDTCKLVHADSPPSTPAPPTSNLRASSDGANYRDVGASSSALLNKTNTESDDSESDGESNDESPSVPMPDLP
ncbi:hypothetical protein HGRIS_007553 [Hohenbuehelia grisea]|uniref:Uncharacterized protein n=1 Tax=Hohenbuehelia grisea TaxID=104357 RepID=A0ABR3J5D4_9AGAR